MPNGAQSASRPVLLESREGAILTLTLNRPDKMNALNIELTSALLDALRRAAADTEIRAIVITGAGRAFCAGGDLALIGDARRRNAGHELESLLRGGSQIALAIRDVPVPVLAAVNGAAAGAGMNVALACDLRIASESAVFGQNFAKVGLFPDFGGMFFLPRLVGPARAAEMFYTGDMISAVEAERIGVVNHVVPHDRLAEEARALAGKLAAAPPIAARAVKNVLFGADRAALEQALEMEIRQQVECFLSNDCAEGLRAFFEKRAPQFTGR
ncbi:MAG: enoyl-CoA hydratase/isomerase family protein [Acidobacteria bacterium]|nr:enoyl-CoA hydratase/isomerase family protein [Acidobacteriota bacterium]